MVLRNGYFGHLDLLNLFYMLLFGLLELRLKLSYLRQQVLLLDFESLLDLIQLLLLVYHVLLLLCLHILNLAPEVFNFCL